MCTSTTWTGSAVPDNQTLIISDLDGTLLRSDKSLSERTRRSLLAAREAGLRTAVASARPLRLVDQVIDDAASLFDALIVSNGAAVIDASRRETLHENRLPAEDSDRIIDIIRGAWPNAGFGWELGTHFVGDQAFVELARDTAILRDPVEEETSAVPHTGVHQLVFAVVDIPPADMVGEVSRMLGADYWVTDSNGGVVEISSSTVTKAEGARWWAESIGKTLADVVAFGDELNDAPLLRDAGRGYAMANAALHVQSVADGTTASNDEDGVAIVIEQLVTRNGATR